MKRINQERCSKCGSTGWYPQIAPDKDSVLWEYWECFSCGFQTDGVKVALDKPAQEIESNCAGCWDDVIADFKAELESDGDYYLIYTCRNCGRDIEKDDDREYKEQES